MKKLLIGLSALVVLFLSGCASSSSQEPKVNSNTASDTKIRKNTGQCITANDVVKMNRGKIKQIARIQGQENVKLFLALDPSFSAPELREYITDKHFIAAMKRDRKLLFSANIDEVIIWKFPSPGGLLGAAVPFKNGCVVNDYGEPDYLEKLKLMHETLFLISRQGYDSTSVRRNIKKILMNSSYQYKYEDKMINKFINNIRYLTTKY